MSVSRRIGPFEIKEPLHEGGMGTLYLAHDVQRGVQVVVKVSRFSEKMRQEERAFYEEALQAEAEILRELHHPHIVRLYPIRMEDPEGKGQLPVGSNRVVYTRRAVELPGQPWYFAMEYLGGGSLEELLKARRVLPVEVAVEIGYQVAMALEYLHGRGIAHRDIKPHNILFRRPVQEGVEAVLVDFGLAQRQRARGLEAGTLTYMAPEQIEAEKGEAPRSDPRPADVYALGVVLYRMVTGRLPFEGRSREELTSAIRKALPTRPSLIRKDIPAPLDDLILEMLVKEPEKRPSAAWVARRLNEAIPWHRRFLELEGREGADLARTAVPRRPARSPAKLALIAGLFAFAIAGWGLYLFGGRLGGESVDLRPAVTATAPAAFATPTPLVIVGGAEPTPTPMAMVEPTATPLPTRTPTPTLPPPTPLPNPASGP
ncbi:serine/threonine-protein kinase [Thermoflexus sp.]|nr:serine/threonine-protein kinase [Thermoflexus sp.]MDW8184809.1 serine/threonine-protein kinase [Anaerolineae bacterium]